MSAQSSRTRKRLLELAAQCQEQLQLLLYARSPLIRGSFGRRGRVCGNPSCHCTRGELHESLYVGQGAEGTTKMAYVPSDWEADVKDWVRRYQRAKTLLERLSARTWRALSRRER